MAKTTKNTGDLGSKRYRIETPVKGFSGVRSNVHFTNGVGETRCLEDARTCQGLGYAVTDPDTGKAVEWDPESDA